MVFKDKQVEGCVAVFGTNIAYFSDLLSKLCVSEKEIKSYLHFFNVVKIYYFLFIAQQVLIFSVFKCLFASGLQYIG